MLCGRSKGIEDAWKRVRSENGFIMEEKLDGERMQLHKRGNQYFYCSRFAISLPLRTSVAKQTEQEREELYLPLWE
jgi:hypothetical protein